MDETKWMVLKSNMVLIMSGGGLAVMNELRGEQWL